MGARHTHGSQTRVNTRTEIQQSALNGKLLKRRIKSLGGERRGEERREGSSRKEEAEGEGQQ